MDWGAVVGAVNGAVGAVATVVALGVGAWKFLTRTQANAVKQMEAAVAAREKAEEESRQERQVAREAHALVTQMLLDEIAELKQKPKSE